MNIFVIIPADYFIWNYDDLLKFLIKNQRRDIRIDTHEEGCCLTSIGLYKTLDLFSFKSVEICTTNIVEYHAKYKITITPAAFKFFRVDALYDNYHTWNKKYIFGALYNRAIWHRIGLASYLLLTHSNISLINFRSDPHTQDSRTLFELQRLFNYDIDSVSNFISVINKLPVQLESIDGYTVGATTIKHTNQLKDFYVNFLIDIVAETFTSGRSFFPTEKTVRSILLKKPFIVMGPKCFLIHLRQMGFRTFYEFWDEEYDGYSGQFRYKKILKLIDEISKKSIDELEKMYTNMKEILDHNYNLLISQQYNKQITYVN